MSVYRCTDEICNADWHVPAGSVTAPEQFNIFQGLLGNATLMDTGFIVLEHDLFEITVDLAVGYTLDAALNHKPAFNVRLPLLRRL